MSLNNKEQKIERKREIYLDILRIIAIFAIIIVHTSAQNWYKTDVFSFEWNIFNIYDSMFKWGTPIFVMISGALFLSANYSIEKIYKKNILRIIIAFIFWSLIYTFLFSKHSTLKDFIINFSKGCYHMWFLYMIIGLYILVPFFKKIIEDEFLMKYFLILSFIFSIVCNQLKAIISIPELKLDTLNTCLFTNILDKMDIHFVVGFSFYFILGYYLHKTIIDSKKSTLIYFLGILGLISTIIFSALISIYLGKPNQLFYNRFTVNMFFYTLSIFVFIKNFFKNFKFTDKQKIIIIQISKCTFGAYLVHVLILNYLKKLAITTLSFNPVFSVLTIGIIVFCLSFLISALLSKIPFLNKYIV